MSLTVSVTWLSATCSRMIEPAWREVMTSRRNGSLHVCQRDVDVVVVILHRLAAAVADGMRGLRPRRRPRKDPGRCFTDWPRGFSKGKSPSATRRAKDDDVSFLSIVLVGEEASHGDQVSSLTSA